MKIVERSSIALSILAKDVEDRRYIMMKNDDIIVSIAAINTL